MPIIYPLKIRKKLKNLFNFFINLNYCKKCFCIYDVNHYSNSIYKILFFNIKFPKNNNLFLFFHDQLVKKYTSNKIKSKAIFRTVNTIKYLILKSLNSLASIL